jgi:hypothetical protein
MYLKKLFPDGKLFRHLCSVFQGLLCIVELMNNFINKQRICLLSFLMKLLYLNYVRKMTLNWKVVLGPKLLKPSRVS